MIGTFSALLLAHVLADFLLQTDAMVRHKRHPGVMALHIALVLALSAAALGGGWLPALAVAGAHLVIDAVKTWALPSSFANTLTAFLTDQAAHLATLLAAALLWPGTLDTGLWAPWLPTLLPAAIGTAGAIAAVFAGGHAVGLLMKRFTTSGLGSEGLPEAGRLIGQLERAMIFLLVLIGEPAGVGFLIAAKSVLRFDTVSKSQKVSEYVIVGTLASFAWALAVAHLTLVLLRMAGG